MAARRWRSSRRRGTGTLVARDIANAGEELDEQRLAALIEVGRSLVSRARPRDAAGAGARRRARADRRPLRRARRARRVAPGARALRHARDRRRDAPRDRRPAARPRDPRPADPRSRRPLRLHDLRTHPRSYGFPANHPPMHSFLGVPILIRGNAWGNLYLTDKEGGADFDAARRADGRDRARRLGRRRDREREPLPAPAAAAATSSSRSSRGSRRRPRSPARSAPRRSSTACWS